MPVSRLLPDLKAGDKKPEWNFKLDSPEEARYNKCVAAIFAADDLKKYADTHNLVTAQAMTPAQADTICTTTATHQMGVQNDFVRSGVECRAKLYRDAAAARYDINNADLRAKLDRLVSLYHSYMYDPFTESGRLLT